jgi:precorrin-6B methylase 2
VPRQEAEAATANAQARPAPNGRAIRWPPTRLAAVEALWGDRFNGPIGEAETIRLAGPLALGPEDKLLLIGGGLGGPACAIAADRGAFVSNFEADAELASLARLRVEAHRCGERVVIEGWNPDYPDFGIRACDHAMLLEALRAGDPLRTLESLAASLRPRSRIVMTEMVTDRPSPGTDREFAAWCRLENRHAGLPRADAITTALRRLHYDVREVEDISSTHVTAVLAGWRNAVKTMDEAPVPSAASASVVVTEAELWLLRIRVMRRFGFRLLRWHAIGTAGRAVGAASG